MPTSLFQRRRRRIRARGAAIAAAIQQSKSMSDLREVDNDDSVDGSAGVRMGPRRSSSIGNDVVASVSASASADVSFSFLPPTPTPRLRATRSEG